MIPADPKGRPRGAWGISAEGEGAAPRPPAARCDSPRRDAQPGGSQYLARVIPHWARLDGGRKQPFLPLESRKATQADARTKSTPLASRLPRPIEIVGGFFEVWRKPGGTTRLTV